jgi:nucleoside-diphosphate-sugar epimerase
VLGFGRIGRERAVDADSSAQLHPRASTDEHGGTLDVKVLVTGAGGNLARVVVPVLAAAGHTLRLLDFRPIDTTHELLQGDLRNPDDLARAVDGVDAVVHAAALHGIHRDHWSTRDFWSINVDGTFNLYEAATTAKVAKVVLASSMAVYGATLLPPADACCLVTEDSPILPDDEYGLSKWLCEELARYHARRHEVPTVALRLGMFVPETFERYGFRLLFGGVDDRDVAQAVLLALEHAPAGSFEAVNVMAEVPFQATDAAGLHADPAAVLERYWPGCTRLFTDRGLELVELLWDRLIWPIDKARRVLGYRPGTTSASS